MTAVARKVGLLTLILLPYVLLAAWLHHQFLPRGYSWLAPVRTLSGVVREPYFPTLAAVALAIGAVSRLPPGGFRALFEKLNRPVDRASLRRPAVGAAIAITVLLTLAIFTAEYEPSDFPALFAIGAVFGAWRWSRQGLLRAALQLAYVVVVFTVVSYAFTVVKAMLFHFRAPHDEQIVALEAAIFRCQPHRLIARWASTRPWAVILSDQIYFSLFNHMTLVSLFLIGARDKKQRTELISALVICYVLGAFSYYLWPGLGPGYFDVNEYSYLLRLPISTRYVRALLLENTAGMATGHPRGITTYAYIACMPSLHMAHEFVMLWYARTSRIALAISIVFTTMTVFAIVILGWHYPIDAIGGAMLAAIAIVIARRNRDRLFPAALTDP